MGTENHLPPQALCSLLFLPKELAGRVFSPTCEATHRPTSFLIEVLHFVLEALYHLHGGHRSPYVLRGPREELGSGPHALGGAQSQHRL